MRKGVLWVRFRRPIEVPVTPGACGAAEHLADQRRHRCCAALGLSSAETGDGERSSRLESSGVLRRSESPKMPVFEERVTHPHQSRIPPPPVLQHLSWDRGRGRRRPRHRIPDISNATSGVPPDIGRAFLVGSAAYHYRPRLQCSHRAADQVQMVVRDARGAVDRRSSTPPDTAMQPTLTVRRSPSLTWWRADSARPWWTARWRQDRELRLICSAVKGGVALLRRC